jgi:uncharacterized protein YehS (DUF1456 family)
MVNDMNSTEFDKLKEDIYKYATSNFGVSWRDKRPDREGFAIKNEQVAQSALHFISDIVLSARGDIELKKIPIELRTYDNNIYIAFLRVARVVAKDKLAGIFRQLWSDICSSKSSSSEKRELINFLMYNIEGYAEENDDVQRVWDEIKAYVKGI